MPSSTRDGFSPRRSSTKPSTTSRSPFVRRPCRAAACADCTTRATSPTVTGVPSVALQHDVLDVVGGCEVADAADRELLVAVAQEAAADVQVRLARAPRSTSASVRSCASSARRIDLDVDLLQVAAERHHVGDARHLAQHARDVPLAARSAAGTGRGGRCARGTGRSRRAAWRRARAPASTPGGRSAVASALRRPACARWNASTSSSNVSVTSDSPNRLSLRMQRHARRAVQRALERHRDLALDLLGRVARAAARSP